MKNAAPRTARARARSRSRGFSLVEITVSAALGVAITAAAFEMVRYQTRQIGITSESVAVSQNGRAALAMLAEDLAAAGSGVGYTTAGTFAGLKTGSFTAGGATFQAQGRALALADVPSGRTDDLGVVLARGPYATIASFNLAGGGELCTVPDLPHTSLVVMRSEDELASVSARVVIDGPTGCSKGVCVGGCTAFHFTADPTFASDPGAATSSYLGGELAANLSTVVWFVEADDPSRPGIGALRRASFDADNTCSARDHTCGTMMADYVETLQVQYWRYDATTRTWANVTNGPLDGASRLRVDVELVLRSTVESDRAQSALSLRLDPGQCLPSCTSPDRIERRAFRTSVEIKNSGRMRIR